VGETQAEKKIAKGNSFVNGKKFGQSSHSRENPKSLVTSKDIGMK
jgi:hypothetical protein